MSQTATPALPVRNQLLKRLPPQSLARLLPMLTPAELPFRATLYGVNDRIAKVYFPQMGWVSLLAPLENGDVAEVGLVGSEGMIGLPLALGVEHDSLEAMVQGEGVALTLDADVFQDAMRSDAEFRSLLLRYTQAHLIQVSCTAACNGHHLLEQRLARWLLMSHDRAEGNRFGMTHEFLSMMLGVRRSGISVAAGGLQKAGLICYERGFITVTDRPGLENASCECYGIVRRSSESVHVPGPRGSKPYRA